MVIILTYIWISRPQWVKSGKNNVPVIHILGIKPARINSIPYMMTSSNGNIFRVTGPLCGEFTGPGEFPAQRPVTRSFDVFFHLRLNKRLSKQPWGWWFETPGWSLWRHRNDPSLTHSAKMEALFHNCLHMGTDMTRLQQLHARDRPLICGFAINSFTLLSLIWLHITVDYLLALEN